MAPFGGDDDDDDTARVALALREFCASSAPLGSAEDAKRFRSQLLDGAGGSCAALSADAVLASLSPAAYVDQLAAVLVLWWRSGRCPLHRVPEAVAGVTETPSNREMLLSMPSELVDAFVDGLKRAEDELARVGVCAAFIERLGGARGVLTLLGFRETVGSRSVCPLTRAQCVEAFNQRHKNVVLTVGARAFSKHCERSADGWWGHNRGNDEAKNRVARLKLEELLDGAVWKNLHSLPHAHATMEIRNALGFGARWTVEDGALFRGFLEPPMAGGHETRRTYTHSHSHEPPSMRLASIALQAVGCLLVLSKQVAAAPDDGSLTIACVLRLPQSDQDNGFGAEEDASCATDKSDCFQTDCRLCAEHKTDRTTDLVACGVVRARQAARKQALAALGNQQQAKQEKSLEAAVIESAPEPLSNADCAARVSPGDQSAGLTAIYNPGCASGGLGCFAEVRCQFCRLKSTTSQAYKLCSELPGATTAMDCASAVKSSGYLDASFVEDSKCLTDASIFGCIAATRCRVCREAKSEDNERLPSCKVLRESQALASAAEAASADITVVTASLAELSSASTSSGSSPLAVSKDESNTLPFCAAAVAGAVVALAAVAIRNSRTRRVVDASGGDEGGDHLQRIDSIVQDVGRDRIVTL
ncbi:hypothetical protein PybrP1_010293 [[Pythium] brassicae (nom. inval.)]|nr:hypothetical protein PybrP1_010293 [[Pythium] brassicae (nom. inval.)]